jgi:hypothetical protein
MRSFTKKHDSNTGKNFAVVFYDNNQISVTPIIDIGADNIETKDAILHTGDAEIYVNNSQAGLVYVYQANIPAMVEAENLKSLRRSVALRRVFDFDTSSGAFDLFKWIPYIIIIVMVLFR